MALLLTIMACQPGRSTAVIGVLSQTPALAVSLDGFKSGMSDLGYAKEDGIVYIYNGPTAFDALAIESKRLLDQNVNMVFALGTPAAIAAKNAIQGTDVPVVFGPVYDPLQSGLVRDLINPG